MRRVEHRKPKQNGRIQIDSKAKEIISSTTSKSTKLQEMNDEIMFKIDEILNQYKGNEKLIPDINQNSISTNNQSDIKDDFALPVAIQASPIIKNEPLPKIVKRNSAKISQIPIKDTNPFMTDVGLVKATKKRKGAKKQSDKLMARTDKEINDLIRNIDEIGTDNGESFEGSLEFKARMAKEQEDFNDLLKELEDYKQQIHEEFDEVKYLIKFADNTHRLIDRHKTVISSIFKGAGLKARPEQMRENKMMRKNDRFIRGKQSEDDYINEQGENEEDEYEGEDVDDSIRNFNGVFNKLKKINQIKENLSNIQDDCLGYHEKFKTNIKVPSKNDSNQSKESK